MSEDSGLAIKGDKYPTYIQMLQCLPWNYTATIKATIIYNIKAVVVPPLK